MKNKKYNGWTNWDTWEYGLIIDSYENLRGAIESLAFKFVKQYPKKMALERLRAEIYKLRSRIKKFDPDVNLRKVNYKETAEHYVE